MRSVATPEKLRGRSGLLGAKVVVGVWTGDTELIVPNPVAVSVPSVNGEVGLRSFMVSTSSARSSNTSGAKALPLLASLHARSSYARQKSNG